jgi:hypothetical protein
VVAVGFHDDGVKVPAMLSCKTDVLDVCAHMPRLPETVYIIASGPNGAEAALTIPETECTISCNSAILMPRTFTWACFFDHRIVCYSWWETVDLKGAKVLMSARLLNRLAMPPAVRQIPVSAYFEYKPDISWPHGNNPRAPKMPRAHFLDRTRLRGGCTVSGVALQFAHYGGAKNIVLCGVDMEGRGHWDGFQNPDKYNLCGGVWPWVEPLQILCDIITERGTKVWTMSKTALRLPTWEG